MRSKAKSWFIAAILLVSVVSVTSAATNTIQIFNTDFGTAPSTHIDPVILRGDTIQWDWVTGIHSTTSAGGQLDSWDSGAHTPPFSFSHAFNEVGTFTYFCTVHGSGGVCGNAGGMSGKIIVVLPGTSPYRVTAVSQQGDDFRVDWVTGGSCKTNILQRATGAADGSFTNNFTDIFFVTNTVGNATNYIDAGATTNFPTSYYRVRVP